MMVGSSIAALLRGSRGSVTTRLLGPVAVVTIVAALMAVVLLIFAGGSSDTETVDAAGPEPGMALQFFPDTQKSGNACTNKCEGTNGETFSIDVITDPSPPAGFTAYKIIIEFSGVKLVKQAGVDENRVPACNPLLIGHNNAIAGRHELSCNNQDQQYSGVLANIHFLCNPSSNRGS